MITLNMSTLKERLEEALEDAKKLDPKISKTAIWKACGISSGAVSQWFSGGSQKIEGSNLLNAARVLNVKPYGNSVHLKQASLVLVFLRPHLFILVY